VRLVGWLCEGGRCDVNEGATRRWLERFSARWYEKGKKFYTSEATENTQMGRVIFMLNGI
jgi:hypothetical protein